jgi:DNA-binding response OmpR family regulator
METKNKIFLVEDDLSFGSVLKAYLEIYEYQVEWISDGEKAIPAFEQDEFDICILDVMLPHIDGFQLAEKINLLRPEMPFIFLTAKTLKADEVRGYKLGADDYIKKPFDSEILLLKLQAILNRKIQHQNEEQPHSYQIGKYVLKPKFRELLNVHSNQVQKLSPKEAELLKMLIESKSELLLRDEALRKIWGDDNYFTKRSMDVYITKLRKYLKDDPSIEILNVHGSGFRLLCR